MVLLSPPLPTHTVSGSDHAKRKLQNRYRLAISHRSHPISAKAIFSAVNNAGLRKRMLVDMTQSGPR